MQRSVVFGLGDHFLAVPPRGFPEVGDVKLGGASAPGFCASLHGAEVLKLAQGGLHALHGDPDPASQFTVGQSGLAREVPERGEMAQRQPTGT